MTDRDDPHRPAAPAPGSPPPNPQSWHRAARPDDDDVADEGEGALPGPLTPPRYDDGDSRVFYEGDG